MNATQLMSTYCVGGAALGLWVVVRFPRFGPKTLLGAGAAVLAGLAIAGVLSAVIGNLIAAWGRTGGLVALVGLVLPVLAAIFWSAACLLRAFCQLLAGMR